MQLEERKKKVQFIESTQNNRAVKGDADLNIYSWNVEDCGLHVIRFGLQRGGALLPSEEMSGGGVGRLQLLLLGWRLLVQTPEAALTAPVTPTGKPV